MKGCLFWLKAWLFVSAIFSTTFLTCHGLNLLWMGFTAECDTWCRSQQLSKSIATFANQNPIFTIVLFAAILSALLVAAAAAGGDDAEREKPKTGDQSGEVPTVGRGDPTSHEGDE